MNPFLAKLNLPDDARAVVIHADDIGMSFSTLGAFRQLLENSVLTSAAVMTPCPWFPAAAGLVRELHHHPRLDLGVHLTLTSEWDSYRWGPRTTRDPASGLIDKEGYFHRREIDVWAHADPAAVETELRAQIDAALAAGIDVTHIDSHMGTLFHPTFLPIYMKLARAYQLPAFLLQPTAEHMQSAQLDAEAARVYRQEAAQAQDWGLPLFDSYHVMSLQRTQGGLEEAAAVLTALPPGSLSYLILHPNIDTPDLRAFAPDWRARVDDFALLTSTAFRKLLQGLHITPVSMGNLRDVLRRGM